MPTEHPPESVRGVVLAGGDSTRFDAGDKALATLGSETVLSRILDVLDQTTNRPPAIAVRTDDQRTTYADTLDRTDVRFVFDDADHDGPLAGILGAATALQDRWLFCCGCDMPRLDPAAVRWILDRTPPDRALNGSQADAIAVEHPTGIVEPLHTVYRRERVVELRESLPREAGPRSLLSAFDSACVISTAMAPVGVRLAASITNVNTRDEFVAVRNRIDDS